MTELTLYQFNRSHYNERVRWALDFKGLPHKRVSLLPGPHAGKIKAMSDGQTSVPLLDIDGEIVHGSGAILDRLEALAPSPALMPADPALQEQVREAEQWFVDELGPAIRLALFAEMVQHGGFMAQVFASQKGLAARTAYAMTFPFVRPLMVKAFGINDRAKVARANETVAKALKLIEQQTAETGYFVGDKFTRADLTIAALTSIVADPDHIDIQMPFPRPKSVSAYLEKYTHHAGAQWVREMYANHRPAPLASA